LHLQNSSKEAQFEAAKASLTQVDAEAEKIGDSGLSILHWTKESEWNRSKALESRAMNYGRGSSTDALFDPGNGFSQNSCDPIRDRFRQESWHDERE
jgi:hypothetical protein